MFKTAATSIGKAGVVSAGRRRYLRVEKEKEGEKKDRELEPRDDVDVVLLLRALNLSGGLISDKCYLIDPTSCANFSYNLFLHKESA